MKTSFNLDDYKGKYAMHCQTEDEADNFLEVLYNAGREWSNGESYAKINYYRKNGHHTVYYFNIGKYGDERKVVDNTILEWSDFMEDEISDEEFCDMLSDLLGIRKLSSIKRRAINV